LNGPSIAGIKAAHNNYKVVYLGFCFEQIPTEAARDTLIARMINFFSVEPAVYPSAPELVYPSNSQVLDTTSVQFVWHQSQPQVSTYQLELDTTAQFNNPIVNSNLTDTAYVVSGLLPGKNYWWRVRAQNSWGWGDFSSVGTFSIDPATGINSESQLPISFDLQQNFPNPFNPSTRIVYSLAEEVQVNLTVYDMLGRKVAELVNDKQVAGVYELAFNGSSFASGMYIYKLKAGDFVSVKKMVLLK
jgi:hypothetical protein